MKIFIVEDDDFYREYLRHIVSMNANHEVQAFASGNALLAMLHEQPEVVCIDYTLPDISGEELLKQIKAALPQTQVLVISGQEDVKTALSLLNKGASEYLVKDEETRNRLWHIINKIEDNVQLRNKVDLLEHELEKKYEFNNIIVGNSTAIRSTFKLIEKAAKSKIVVSISGETGTGKELAAKAIHYNSARSKAPFVVVNVAAIPHDLIESELFGHEKGAFTGAHSRRIGLFEQAHGGTLFLDEIAELDIALQVKLLRVLQEREFRRVGGNKAISTDVRVIVATHKNLAEEVKAGNFREDLYYRLLGLPIQLPPLRNRQNDVLLIARYFCRQYAQENKIAPLTLSPEAQKKLLSYHFPGNVRELKAVIELACVMADSDNIEGEHLVFNQVKRQADLLSEEKTLQEYNQEIIHNFLERYNRNVVLVAKKLGIGKSTIYRMLQKGEL